MILAIQSYPSGNEGVARHWEHFKKSGADELIGISTTDGGCVWPENCQQQMIGANLYCAGNHLPIRLLRTFERLLETRHGWLAVCEWDVLFFKPVPLRAGLTTHLAGHEMPGHYCKHFYHPPWIVDRDTALSIVVAGYELIAAKTVDASPDCFIGQIVDKTGIPVHTDLGSYSRNTIHGDAWTAEARAAIDAGAPFVHGVKHKEVFDALTK